MVGYVIFLACAVMLAGIGFIGGRKVNKDDINSIVFAGGHAGGTTMTFSIFAAWMWTTSILGASETYSLYGVWGPISYVGGACIAFGGLIGFLAFLRKKMPNPVMWLEFIRARYGMRTKQFYYLFAIVIPAYVLVEQGVGIGYILEAFYGSSFKIVSFLSVMLAMGIVLNGGMRSTLAVENFTAVVILSGLAVGISVITTKGEIGCEAAGTICIQMSLPANMIIAALRYFIMAVVIAFGQIVFDPAWYLKANLAESVRCMIRSYSIGGILLWGGTSLIVSIYLGRIASVNGEEITDIFTGLTKVIFSIIIILIGVSTISHYMMGIFGLSITDLHAMITGDDGTERDKIVFGHVVLIAFGVFCASMTIALEDISLLSIDVFCAIFFAAPCVPLVIGCLCRRNFGRLPIIASAAGVLCGLVLWTVSSGDLLYAQFKGMAASIIVPLAIMMLGFLKKMSYDR